MTVLLQDRTLSAVHRLLATEPEVGSLVPEALLRTIHQRIGCDSAGIGEADQMGYRFRGMRFPAEELGDPQICDGPVPTGLIHDAALPERQRNAPELGLRDMIRFGFDTGRTTVVQFYFSRRVAMFSERSPFSQWSSRR